MDINIIMRIGEGYISKGKVILVRGKAPVWSFTRSSPTGSCSFGAAGAGKACLALSLVLARRSRHGECGFGRRWYSLYCVAWWWFSSWPIWLRPAIGCACVAWNLISVLISRAWDAAKISIGCSATLFLRGSFPFQFWRWGWLFVVSIFLFVFLPLFVS